MTITTLETQVLLQHPEPLLNKVCEPVAAEEWEALPDLVHRMRKAMVTHHGVGIAAPQIGVGKRVCIVKQLLMVNPEPTGSVTAGVRAIEGCLSVGFGNERHPVLAPSELTVKFQDIRGKWITRTFNKWEARIVNHELRHLDGILINEETVKLAEEMERERGLTEGEIWE